MTLVNWEYYSSLYSKVSEDDFEKAEMLAEKEVKAVIGAIRWAEITADTFGYEELKDCICRVIDRMADNSEKAKHLGVSSVSNDGYSESYIQTSEAETASDLRLLIYQCLSGTGLIGAY